MRKEALDKKHTLRRLFDVYDQTVLEYMPPNDAEKENRIEY